MEVIRKIICQVFKIQAIELYSSRSETTGIADAKRIWAMMLQEEGVSVKDIASICCVTRNTVYDRLDAFNIRIQCDDSFKRHYLACVSKVTAHEFDNV